VRRDRPFLLAELIDLELELVRDRDRPLEHLDARDAPIAQRIAAAGAQGREALRLWLAAAREPASSLGTRIARLRGVAAFGLFAFGALLGIATVGSWLLSGTGSPVNVIRFWPAVIGVQLALLVLWCAAALPQPWLGRLLPWVLGRGLLAALRVDRAAIATTLAELRRLEWLYARLRLWLVTSLTQSFAVGFNLGALTAFVAIPYIDDPAFGWRSRMLEVPAVTRLAETVALPWRSWLPRAVPSSADVAATRYSSIDPALTRDERPGPRSVWAVWWSFLVASLAIHGLAPRLLLWLLAHIGVAWELRRAPRAHADLARLQERLARRPLDTRARAAESAGSSTGSDTSAVATESLPSGPLHVLCWSGVPLDDRQIRARLADTGAEVATVARVGVLDRAQDARALEGIAAQGATGPSACLVVPAWEPPAGEYLDFVRDLRAALGDGRALWVLLYPLGASPGPDAGAAQHWRAALQARGDPWLRLARWPEAPA